MIRRAIRGTLQSAKQRSAKNGSASRRTPDRLRHRDRRRGYLTAAEGVFRIAFKRDKRAKIQPRYDVPDTTWRWLLRRKFLIGFAVVISLSILSLSLPLSAHHGNAAYDATKQINLKGTVTQFIWANPHCVVLFDPPDYIGHVAHSIPPTENPPPSTNT